MHSILHTMVGYDIVYFIVYYIVYFTAESSHGRGDAYSGMFFELLTYGAHYHHQHHQHQDHLRVSFIVITQNICSKAFLRATHQASMAYKYN